MSRQFKEMLFLGNELAEGRVRALHNLLDFAVTTLGYLQQPPHSRNECEAKHAVEHNRQADWDIREAVRDLAMALTGDEIDFRPKVWCACGEPGPCSECDCGCNEP